MDGAVIILFVLAWLCIGLVWYELRGLRQRYTAHSLALVELRNTATHLERWVERRLDAPNALRPTTYMPPMSSGMILSLTPVDPRPYTEAPPSHPRAAEEGSRWDNLELGRTDGVQKEE